MFIQGHRCGDGVNIKCLDPSCNVIFETVT
jgi:hypothetical protein